MKKNRRKKLLVFGDSFCAFRQSKDHWPFQLAEDLHMDLVGFGLPGASWWFVRQKLLALLDNLSLSDVELSVVCHTEPNRIIGTKETIQHIDQNRSVIRTYLSQLENIDFNHWTCAQWFREINDIFLRQKVMHLQNFLATDNYFGQLNGILIKNPTLAEFSQRGDTGAMVNDLRYNHFSVAQNHALAQQLAAIYHANKTNWSNHIAKIEL